MVEAHGRDPHYKKGMMKTAVPVVRSRMLTYVAYWVETCYGNDLHYVLDSVEKYYGCNFSGFGLESHLKILTVKTSNVISFFYGVVNETLIFYLEGSDTCDRADHVGHVPHDFPN